MLEAVATQGQVKYDAILPGDIADFIASHGNFRRFAVVMSGDTGFYSGTKKLLPLLDKCNVNAPFEAPSVRRIWSIILYTFMAEKVFMAGKMFFLTCHVLCSNQAAIPSSVLRGA